MGDTLNASGRHSLTAPAGAGLPRVRTANLLFLDANLLLLTHSPMLQW